MSEKYVEIDLKRLVDLLEDVAYALELISDNANIARHRIEGYLDDVCDYCVDDLDD